MTIITADELLGLVRAGHMAPTREHRLGDHSAYHDEPHKQCRKCHGFFPATEDFFYRDERGEAKLKSWCKTCHCEYRYGRHASQQP
jgi:hypothetical protein